MRSLRITAGVLILGLITAACGGGGTVTPAATTAAPASSATAAAASPAAPKAAVCPAQSVKIAVPVTPPNVVHLPPYVAKELGYFKDENLTVELVRFEGGVGALRAMVAGGVDLAGTSTEPVLQAISQGVDVKIVGSYSPNISNVFAVRDIIKTPADLKGKNIGIQEPGGFADALSRAYLKKNNIDPKDVNFVTTTTAARVQQMVAGAVDTGILHVDQILNVQKTTPSIKILANMWEVLPEYQYAVYAMPASKAKSDLAECLMRAITKASRAMYDPALREKILTLAVKETKADKAIVEQAYKQLEAAKAWPQNEGVPKKNIDGTIALQLDSKQITKALTFEEVTDLSAVTKVVNQLGRKDFPY
jgi:ABC-type nitrate/sulfonate/bicarbonate transport system substrate-binding protein